MASTALALAATAAGVHGWDWCSCTQHSVQHKPRHAPGVWQLAGPSRGAQVAAALCAEVARMADVLSLPLGVGRVAAQRVQRACVQQGSVAQALNV